MKIYTDEDINKRLKRKSTIKKIISLILYPIITVLAICSIILVIQVIQNPEVTPNLFGFKAFSVVSGSMEPTLKIGDVVIIKKVEQEKINKDDIITFTQEETEITHRIVDIVLNEGEILYQTKGDNNNVEDKDLVRFANIQGIYVCKIPMIGKIVGYLKNTKFLLIIILFLYIIYKILQVKDDRKIARHEKRKELEKNK